MAKKFRTKTGSLEPKALRVIELYSAGKSIVEIRDLLHASLPYIQEILKETGFTAKHKPVPYFQLGKKRLPK